ncbi:MAG: 4'-phosphopantetheinyl transferase superfamily protein [Bacteroidota bacterium]
MQKWCIPDNFQNISAAILIHGHIILSGIVLLSTFPAYFFMLAAISRLISMPVLCSLHPFPGATFGLWQIVEEPAFFSDDLPLSASEATELAPLKGLRRMEWLAVRWLLHKVTGVEIRLPLAKDAFSKPFFPEHRHLSCSLSHSQGVVGALLAEPGDLAIGCDVQMMVEKMARLAPKFLHEREWEFVYAQPETVHADLFHIFWTAKESLYKAHGSKELDFREHLYLAPFEWDGQRGQGKGLVQKGAFRQPFDLWFEKIQLPDNQELIWTVCRPA